MKTVFDKLKPRMMIYDNVCGDGCVVKKTKTHCYIRLFGKLDGGKPFKFTKKQVNEFIKVTI